MLNKLRFPPTHILITSNKKEKEGKMNGGKGDREEWREGKAAGTFFICIFIILSLGLRQKAKAHLHGFKKSILIIAYSIYS